MRTFSMISSGILLASLFGTGHQSEHHFGYNDEDNEGPKHWTEGSCGSHVRQSPINIVTNRIVYGEDFKLEYNDESSELQGILTNNGHAPSFSFDNSSRILSVESVPGLGDATFKLLSFHLHFGHDDTVGSEHTIDGVSYPSEMHFVHINTKYSTIGDALLQSDGLAVIGVFLEISTSANPELVKLTNQMQGVTDEGSTVSLSVNPNLLMPDLDKVMAYAGSLTTPPCSEVVQWLLAKETKPITSAQLNILRALRVGHGASSVLISKDGNDRPLQPANDREVDANFDD